MILVKRHQKSALEYSPSLHSPHKRCKLCCLVDQIHPYVAKQYKNDVDDNVDDCWLIVVAGRVGWLWGYGCSRVPCLSVPAASLLVDAQPNTSVFPPLSISLAHSFPCPWNSKAWQKILLSPKSFKVRLRDISGYQNGWIFRKVPKISFLMGISLTHKV